VKVDKPRAAAPSRVRKLSYAGVYPYEPAGRCRMTKQAKGRARSDSITAERAYGETRRAHGMDLCCASVFLKIKNVDQWNVVLLA